MKILESLESIDKFIIENKVAMLYFSSQNCSVCVGLLPKIKELLKKYSKIAYAKVEIDEVQLTVGKYSVFTVPTVIMFIESKEIIRQSRFISIIELQEKIERFYNLI
ncbi:thioredoxin family protein [Sinanaerobacter chloroacetimidivorans]|uniref:Thioredoxin family protein n=1 Tax=Sinanaerobacter chloroacetimidivorans TaxID=2818044 RepID=A0A8J7W4R0_9FIRM|nr:thioredoxin family protein [Sinanaerobacter chloroacetimidivorans]MBR0600291.1 thioredoxin family protein [Sinanaerobacter chloroacetimidivorans]